MLDRSLWERSGHWEKFGENMFITETPDERVYCCKPMNCPGHVQIFKHGLKSYRDLPLRIAEFGKVHRYEPSGALHGLMRVRAFHAGRRAYLLHRGPDHRGMRQAQRADAVDLPRLRLRGCRIKFSDRPEKRVGSDEVWDKAEAALKRAVEAAGLDYELNPGEGAFYGPKLEYVLRDAIGRDWQCGTFQVDLNLPDRLGAFYIGPDGEKTAPVMLHRAMFGSLERFTGILIEHYAGHLPLWLAPVQVVVATIVSDADAYADEVLDALQAAGLRAEADLRNEKINYKVREHSLAKVPVLLAVGEREAEEGTVSIRRLGSQEQQVMPLEAAIKAIADEARPPDLSARQDQRRRSAVASAAEGDAGIGRAGRPVAVGARQIGRVHDQLQGLGRGRPLIHHHFDLLRLAGKRHANLARIALAIMVGDDGIIAGGEDMGRQRAGNLLHHVAGRGEDASISCRRAPLRRVLHQLEGHRRGRVLDGRLGDLAGLDRHVGAHRGVGSP